MRKNIKIDSYKWELELEATGQLTFVLIIPYKLTSKSTDPLWHTWDADDYTDEISTTYSGLPDNIHPMKLKTKLLTEIANFIKQSKVNFFYFSPTSVQRGRIYSNLVTELLLNLSGKWNHQILNKTWFYFNKIS